MSQFIDVIECMDHSPECIVSRYPAEGSGEIKMGAPLIVRESQAAVFFRDGRALDTFGPGRHTLSTMNIPLLTKMLSLPMGFNSPFKAEVVFVNLKTFGNQKWGTSEPILFRDRELDMVRLRAFGMYSFRIIHPQVFVNTLVGTVGAYSTADTADFFRHLIVTDVADFLGENLDSVLDMAQYYNELSGGMRARLVQDFERYGVTLADFKVTAISPPDHVQEMIDKRAAMAAVGNMDQFLRYQAGQAIEAAAENPGGAGEGMGAGVGIGAGLGVVGGMAGMFNKAMAGAVAPADTGSEAGGTAQILETIRQLGELRDAGALTDEEFQAKKAELLTRI